MFEGIAATLPAADIERAVSFYRDQLGLEPEERNPDGSARYQVGGTMLVVYPSEFAGTNQATAAAFSVSDIASAVATLRARGLVFQEYDYGEISTVEGVMTMPDGSKGAWFHDSEENVVGLFEFAAA
jgi:predicted enzyme related to lactoylglutathione lyase